MPIKQDRHTGKWKIGDGEPRYFTQDSARKAYDNYLKRGGTPVAPKQESEHLG